jgi:acyl-CoA thioesterase I
MAHPDRHAADAARHMAHSRRNSGLGALDPIGSPDGAGGAGPASAPSAWRRALPREPRRREVLAVLSMLLVATILSVTGPIVGAGASRSEPPVDPAVVDSTSDPTVAASPDATADPTADPTDSTDPANPGFTPWPSLAPTSPPVIPTKRPPPKPKQPRNFVALGDSLTAWPNTPWPSRLDAEDPLLHLVHNAGVPANTTSEMRARLSSDVYAYNPDVVFVLGGTNDLGLGISGSATLANLRAIIVGAKAHKITVILLLVPPDSYTSMASKIVSLNNAIMNLARSQHVTYVDIHRPLVNGSGTYWPKYTSDGLHFSDLGAQVVANTIRARLRMLGY